MLEVTQLRPSINYPGLLFISIYCDDDEYEGEHGFVVSPPVIPQVEPEVLPKGWDKV